MVLNFHACIYVIVFSGRAGAQASQQTRRRGFHPSAPAFTAPSRAHHKTPEPIISDRRMNAARPSFTLHVHPLRGGIGGARHVLTRRRVVHVGPALSTPSPARSYSRCLSRTDCTAPRTANMSDQAPSLKRVHTADRSISPPPVKRRQQSTTTSTSKIRTAEAMGWQLTCPSQPKPWRTFSSHLLRSRSLRKRHRGASSRTASSSESMKPPTQCQPPRRTSLARLLFLTLYVRMRICFSHARRRSIAWTSASD